MAGQPVLAQLETGPAPEPRIAVEDPRPLSAAATELEKRFGVVVTYEDAPWIAQRDLADVTAELVRRNGAGQPPPPQPVMVPRSGRLELRYSLEAVAGQPTDPAQLAAELVAQHEASGNPGRFRVEQAEGFLHLIPTQVQKDDGSWMEVQSPLSVLVTLPDEERSIDQAMDLILEQVNRAAKEKVVWGFYPLNLFVQTRVRVAAKALPARDVMRELLQLAPYRFTWKMNFDPMSRQYFLSFVALPGSN
ncbi:MAG TPA: hypothetical protein PK413_00005 [Thermoanaerobaculia bacterium]|nr:hypothetical protein [Thermoanaerobaculia bacterium]